MASGSPLRIYYHRDFDGMVSGAILGSILIDQFGERVEWESVNYDQRRNWETFSSDSRFAIVDFHFHPRAEYWFDHHPTTFLTPELREQYKPSDRWQWDEASPSCPPIILDSAEKHWKYKPTERFKEMAHWSNIVDAARFESVDQAIFGEEPALRITRALTVAPSSDWLNKMVEMMTTMSLEAIANTESVELAHQRASNNRDRALEQFPSTVKWIRDRVLLFDASSGKVRRDRFAPFYHHPEIEYAVGVIPTRSGFHVSCGENPWNKPTQGLHVGEMMEEYGGGGHRAVGGANPKDLDETRRVAEVIAEKLLAAINQPS
ncbi:MAG: oligoribonuclease NrnB/cAMP/cGMP phosphodiesterase (DHH superfamily) [Planctomycetota bacterium]|jgi:oligoribonuclease NrnB/cAMP/cGMP phosphodiesterase (DHH superfamily)